MIRIRVIVYDDSGRPRQRRLVLAAEGTSARRANSDTLLDLVDGLDLIQAQMGDDLAWRLTPLPHVGQGNLDQARYEFARMGASSPKPVEQALAELAELATAEDLAQGPEPAESEVNNE